MPFVTILVCNGCGVNLPWWDAEGDREVLTEEAKCCKWTQDHGGEWYCPTCSLALPYRHEPPEKLRLALVGSPDNPQVVHKVRRRRKA